MRISMIPFGLLSGFMDSKEIRITELGEDGFRFRLAEECPESEQFLIYFYDMKKAGYRRVEIRKFGMSAAEDQCLQDQQPVEKKTGKYFYREYSVRVEQKDYVQEVRRLAGEYNRYIRLKLDGDDGELAKSLTGYPAELDEMHCRSLEEQKKRWFFRENEKASGNPQDTMGAEELRLLDNAEFALELNCTSLYEEYLCQPLQAFLASYWQKNYLTHSYLQAGYRTDFILEISSAIICFRQKSSFFLSWIKCIWRARRSHWYFLISGNLCFRLWESFWKRWITGAVFMG